MGKVIARVREREAAAIERRIKMVKHPEVGSPEWNAQIEAQIRHTHACLEISKRLKRPSLWQRIFGKTQIYYHGKW